MKTAQYLICLAALFGSTASGQTSPGVADHSDIRIVSSFVSTGDPVPSRCREEAHAFARSLVRYPRPDSWHWVLICDEAGWRRFLRLSGRGEHDAIYASTDLSGRTTYLRGAKLLYPYDLHAEPDDIIAHELAHIRLQTSSEMRADSLARLWQGGAKESVR